MYRSMKLQHFFASCCLMQSINILRDDCLQFPCLLQFGKLLMCGIGLCLREKHLVLVELIKLFCPLHIKAVAYNRLRRVFILLVIQAICVMAAQYGVNASIVKELEQINEGLANNINIEILLQDFAARSHDENVQNFADVFEVANRRGGNIRQIILETKNVINDKIMVEQDIQTIISGKKNELNIMMIMPLIVVNMTKSATGDSNGMVGFLVKLAAFCMFILAYVVGQKMMKIEV